MIAREEIRGEKFSFPAKTRIERDTNDTPTLKASSKKLRTMSFPLESLPRLNDVRACRPREQMKGTESEPACLLCTRRFRQRSQGQASFLIGKLHFPFFVGNSREATTIIAKPVLVPHFKAKPCSLDRRKWYAMDRISISP